MSHSRLANLIDYTTLAATTINEIADAAQIPNLRSTSSLSLMILELVSASKATKDQTIQLVEQIHEILCAIIGLYSSTAIDQILPPDVLYGIGKFTETLQKIYTFMKGQQAMGKIKQLFKQGISAVRLEVCRAGLQEALAAFRVQIATSMVSGMAQVLKNMDQQHEELVALLAHLDIPRSDSSSVETGTLSVVTTRFLSIHFNWAKIVRRVSTRKGHIDTINVSGCYHASPRLQHPGQTQWRLSFLVNIAGKLVECWGTAHWHTAVQAVPQTATSPLLGMQKNMRFWCIPQQFKAPQHGPAEGMSLGSAARRGEVHGSAASANQHQYDHWNPHTTSWDAKNMHRFIVASGMMLPVDFRLVSVPGPERHYRVIGVGRAMLQLLALQHELGEPLDLNGDTFDDLVEGDIKATQMESHEATRAIPPTFNRFGIREIRRPAIAIEMAPSDEEKSRGNIRRRTHNDEELAEDIPPAKRQATPRRLRPRGNDSRAEKVALAPPVGKVVASGRGWYTIDLDDG
ncbi:hypothetical protein B0H13DRAFT_1896417 [Mycena leptocephala]|nr:hypothetical protein B0H13DRAFT_1896417 [Mycena leptocephala]